MWSVRHCLQHNSQDNTTRIKVSARTDTANGATELARRVGEDDGHGATSLGGDVATYRFSLGQATAHFDPLKQVIKPESIKTVIFQVDHWIEDEYQGATYFAIDGTAIRDNTEGTSKPL